MDIEAVMGALISQLDELSVRMVVVGADAPETLQVLAAIEKTARDAGRAPAADVAMELQARATGAAKASPEEFERVVTAGIENLRKALEKAEEPATPSQPAADAMAYSIAQDPELMSDFVNEAQEHLATIEAQVLILERDPTAHDPLHAAFRGFHTIKGLAGFLDLGDIRVVSHEVETLLDRARNQELLLTPAIIDVVLESADYLKRAIACVQAGLPGKPAEAPPYDQLLERVRAVLEGKQAAPPQICEEPVASKSADTSKSGGETAFSLRVDAGKLDYMMDMVGELVIAQSLITHNPEIGALESGPLQRNLQQLGRITAEVQRVAMSMRMTPVGTLFGRMNRLVRDLTRKNGKKVRLELAGEETELDKTIIEQLADPMMHMVRNSLDHGLEGPEERAAGGKSPEGTLVLSASHQAGHILIEITDDGRGLNTEKILKKARERGLVPEGQNLSENEIFFLIFEPGFSTAEVVTDVSGRGVGMDVVRRQIQGLRGRIEIRSARGRGTTFLMRLPLTLAIIDGLIVGVGEERYIMPINSVREMLRPTPEMIFTMEGRAEMAMVRGELLPIVRLDRRFAIQGARQNPSEALFVVVEAQGRRFCLLVDEMLGKQEVVIKSLGDTFRHVSGISGGTILADGRVGLILDVNGVLRENANA
ncbi:MAG TPA: chemotaxis protein CheA [Bryobacteraceae bacterium]|nr:chemotaxis protein CheA [Bryobacteraceae bacterium]